MANLMIFLFYIFLGILPSVIWLLFYLRKDVHPESNRMVLKIFFYGMLAALPVTLIEIGFSKGLSKLNLPFIFLTTSEIFIGIAFVEEFSKYLVVRWKVLKSPELDEPIDIMLYMIITALGFAALENIFLLFSFWRQLSISGTLWLTFGRFISATFLHALSSGALGYFLALSFFEIKKRKRLLIEGLTIATVLHGFYNFSIIVIKDPLLKIISVIVILIGLALFVSFAFQKLKKIKSVCLPDFSSATRRQTGKIS